MLKDHKLYYLKYYSFKIMKIKWKFLKIKVIEYFIVCNLHKLLKLSF